MALNKNDIATIINNYRNFIGSKAIPSGFDLRMVESEVRYLEDMLSKSHGDQLPITSPIDIQKVSRAVGILNQVNQFEDLGGFRKKIATGKDTLVNSIARTSSGNDIFKALGKGVQAYNTGKNIKGLKGITDAATATDLDHGTPISLKGAFSNLPSIVNYSNYRTIRDLKELFGKWTRRGGRVQLPNEMLYDAQYQASHPALGPIISVIKKQQDSRAYYLNMMQALSKEEQIRFRPYIDSLANPQKALDLKAINFTNALQSLIQRISSANADKGMYVDNTIITLGNLKTNEMEALGFIEYVTDKASEYITSHTQDFLQNIQELQAIERQMQYVEQRRAPGLTEEQKEQLKDQLIEKSKTVPYNKLTQQEKALIAKFAKEKDLKPDEYYQLFIKKEDRSQDPELLRERQALEERSKLVAPLESPNQAQPQLSDTIIKDKDGNVVIKASLEDEGKEGQPTTTSYQRTNAEDVIRTDSSTSFQEIEDPTTPQMIDDTTIESRLPIDNQADNDNGIIFNRLSSNPITPTKIVPPKDGQSWTSYLNQYGNSPREIETQKEIIRILQGKGINLNGTVTTEDILKVDFTFNESQQSENTVFPDMSQDIDRIVPIQNINRDSQDQDITFAHDPPVENTTPQTEIPSETFSVPVNQPEMIRYSSITSSPGKLVNVGRKGFVNYLSGYFPKGELPNYEDLLHKHQDYLRMAILKRDPLMLLEMPSVLGPTELEKFGSWVKFAGKKIGTDTASGLYDIGGYLLRKTRTSKLGKWFDKKYLKIRLNIRKYYKANRQKGLIGFIRNVRKFVKKGKKDVDGLAVFVLKQLFGKSLTAVIERIKKISVAAAGAIKSAQKTGLIPKSWANLSTSIYKKLENFSKTFNTIEEVQKTIETFREIAGNIRKSFIKIALVVDGLTGTIGSVSTIAGSLFGGLPMGGLSGAIVLLTTGSPVAAIGAGLIVAASNSAVNILGHDYSSITKHLQRIETSYARMMGDPLDGFSGPRNRPGMFTGLFRSVNMAQLKLFTFLQSKGWAKTLPMLNQLSPSAKAIAAFEGNGNQVFNRFARFGRMFNAGITTGFTAIPIAISLLGVGPGLLVGGAITASSMGVRLIADNIANNLAGKASVLKSLASIPLWDTFNTISDIWQFQMELNYIKNKYGWNFGKYFEEEIWNSEKNWSNWIDRFETLGRISNLIGGPSAIYGLFTRFMPYLSRFFTFNGAQLLPKFVAANAGWVALGTGLAFAGALLLGVPLGPMAVTFGLLGGMVGGLIGIGVGSIAAGATWGFGTWSVPIFASGFSFGGTALGIGFGSWLDKLLGNSVNKLISLFNATVNGLQAFFSLLMIWRQGINFANVIQFAMSLITLMSALEFYQTTTGTNSCTTDQECPASEEEGGFLNTKNLSSSYLRYYNVKVVSDNDTQHQVNISRIIKLLEIDGEKILGKHENKEIYIYVTKDLNDVYSNSELLIVATTSVNLYQADSFAGLITNLGLAYSSK